MSEARSDSPADPDVADEDSAPEADGASEAGRARTRQRLSTVFGWLAGGSLGVLLNYAVWRLVGEGYPVTYTTFLFFIPGAFGGMALADRLGPKAFKPLGLLAGVLFALFLGLVIAAIMAPPE